MEEGEIDHANYIISSLEEAYTSAGRQAPVVVAPSANCAFVATSVNIRMNLP